MHHNDRVRVYGIVMAIKSNSSLYQRVAEGWTSRASLDDPSLNLQKIFTHITLSFNNDDVTILLPPDVYDMAGIEEIDANDKSRIRITKYC